MRATLGFDARRVLRAPLASRIRCTAARLARKVAGCLQLWRKALPLKGLLQVLKSPHNGGEGDVSQEEETSGEVSPQNHHLASFAN